MSAPVGHERAVQLEFFTREKPRLFGIANRIVVNTADAEDVVQDVWLRWQNCDSRSVDAPAAFLATATTRLAINTIQSARARHETGLAPRHFWLADGAADPVEQVVRREAVTSAIEALLTRLSQIAERAAYLLREVFDYSYPRVAEIIQATEPTTRQIVSRARKRLASECRNPVRGSEHRRLLHAFLAAAGTGQFNALERLLTADVLRRRRKRRHLSVRRRRATALAATCTVESGFPDAA